MKKTSQEDLLYLSNTLSKMLKRNFGKGPESCYTLLRGNRLYIYMRNFITTGEEVLINYNELNLALTFRSRIIQAMSAEFSEIVTEVIGLSFDSFYQDWNYDTNSGMMLLANHDEKQEEKIEIPFKKDLFELIMKVSSDLHKVPKGLKIIKYTQNICAVEATGSILRLENLLFEKGDVDLLQNLSGEIKKGYLNHRELFEDIFNRNIVDLFMMWDYINDKNYMIFSFDKNYT